MNGRTDDIWSFQSRKGTIYVYGRPQYEINLNTVKPVIDGNSKEQNLVFSGKVSQPQGSLIELQIHVLTLKTLN